MSLHQLQLFLTYVTDFSDALLEPESYLTAVFKAIPLCKTYEDYAELLPWNYAKPLSEAESLGNVA